MTKGRKEGIILHCVDTKCGITYNKIGGDEYVQVG